MKKKPKSKSKNNRKSKSTTSTGSTKETEPRFTWVDRVLDGWVTAAAGDDDDDDDSSSSSSSSTSVTTEESGPLSVSIVSWNVLADTYCSHRSHKRLPMVYQKHVFDRHQRQHHVRQILRGMATGNLCPDLIALQEVDAPLEIPSCMEECGYDGLCTPTDPSGKNGRVDSCALFYRKDKWICVQSESIRLDDIATLCSRNQEGRFNPSTRASLEGIETSFLRKNMALLVRLKHLATGQEVVVATVHLFWNPLYQEVKLCQAHFVATKAHDFAQDAPVLFVGDTNSQPGSAVHEYFWKGMVNAKEVAPWYNRNPFQWEEQGVDNTEELAGKLQVISMEETTSATGPPKVRYMLDFTLNRLCRWLRILGIDAGLETDEEERRRTKEGKYHIFERCRKERRTLVTSSSKMLLRKDCPPGTYRLDTKALANLELSLVHLLLSHGVKLEPRKFLSMCVVCGGQIDRVEDKRTIEAIFAAHNAPESLNGENLEVFQCCGCRQGYWYDERPTSSASRVKNQATKLLKTCIRGGVPIDDDLALFDFIDMEEVKAEVTEGDEVSRLRDQRLDILDWLEQEELKNPLGRLLSAYGSESGEEQLTFTNVTSDFVGHLDYIFHDASFQVEKRLWVPTTFEQLEDNTGVRNGYLLPSNVWPSDHLAIGAVFTLQNSATERETEFSSTDSDAQMAPNGDTKSSNGLAGDAPFCVPTNGTIPPTPFPVSGMPSLASNVQQHGQRCACGCVPNVLSLFEMAELRKKARAAAAAQK